MLPALKVLLLVCDKGEKEKLQQILAPHAELTWACTPQEMTHQLVQGNCDVVFCARTLCKGSWREVVNEVWQLNPNLPVISFPKLPTKENGRKYWPLVRLICWALPIMRGKCFL